MTLAPLAREPRLSPGPQRPLGSLPGRRPDRSQRHGWAPPVVLAAAEGQPCRCGHRAGRSGASGVRGAPGCAGCAGCAGLENSRQGGMLASRRQQMMPQARLRTGFGDVADLPADAQPAEPVQQGEALLSHQQVIPEPKPGPCGRNSRGMPGTIQGGCWPSPASGLRGVRREPATCWLISLAQVRDSRWQVPASIQVSSNDGRRA